MAATCAAYNDRIYGELVDTMQVCTKCKIEKDAFQFHRNTLTASGLVSRCKQCIAEADAKRCEHLFTDREKWRSHRAASCIACVHASQPAALAMPLCLQPSRAINCAFASKCRLEPHLSSRVTI